MSVKKAIFTVTVLFDEDTGLNGMELSDILREMDNGDMLGAVSAPAIENIADEDVYDACREVGNDGEFFGEFYVPHNAGN